MSDKSEPADCRYEEILVTAAQVAQFFGVSSRTVRSWVTENRLRMVDRRSGRGQSSIVGLTRFDLLLSRPEVKSTFKNTPAGRIVKGERTGWNKRNKGE